MRPIFCGNFEYDARQSELERLFRRYGRVDRVDMKSGFAFVYMEDERDGEDAIRALDQIEFGRKGRRLRVEWTKQERGIRRPGGSRRSSNLRPSKTLFVINFDPYRTRPRDLERHFDPHGKIANVRIRRNFAFIQFDTQEDATRALDATHMSKLLDRVISVEYAIRDDNDRGNGYSPDRLRDRSPVRRGYDKGRSPSPYRKERGSPDYGHGTSHSPYRRGGRASPDYGHRTSPSAYRRERAKLDYGHGPSASPHGRANSDDGRDSSPSYRRRDGHIGIHSPRRRDGHGHSTSPSSRKRDSRGLKSSPPRRDGNGHSSSPRRKHNHGPSLSPRRRDGHDRSFSPRRKDGHGLSLSPQRDVGELSPSPRRDGRNMSSSPHRRDSGELSPSPRRRDGHNVSSGPHKGDGQDLITSPRRRDGHNVSSGPPHIRDGQDLTSSPHRMDDRNCNHSPSSRSRKDGPDLSPSPSRGDRVLSPISPGRDRVTPDYGPCVSPMAKAELKSSPNYGEEDSTPSERYCSRSPAMPEGSLV